MKKIALTIIVLSSIAGIALAQNVSSLINQKIASDEKKINQANLVINRLTNMITNWESDEATYNAMLSEAQTVDAQVTSQALQSQQLQQANVSMNGS